MSNQLTITDDEPIKGPHPQETVSYMPLPDNNSQQRYAFYDGQCWRLYPLPKEPQPVTVFDLFSEHPDQEPIREAWLDFLTRRVPLVKNEFNQFIHPEKPSFVYRGTIGVRPGQEPLIYRHSYVDSSPRPVPTSAWTYPVGHWRPYVPPEDPQPDHVVG